MPSDMHETCAADDSSESALLTGRYAGGRFAGVRFAGGRYAVGRHIVAIGYGLEVIGYRL